MKTKRVNKNRDELINERLRFEKINREKTLVKLIFPLIENQKTIYDAQTVLAATSGFIKAEIDKKIAEIVVRDLKIDISKEENSDIKTAILLLLDMLAIEKAKDISDLLQRFSNILTQHSANEFMKQSMKSITVDKIVA